jgi:hypothetical protein
MKLLLIGVFIAIAGCSNIKDVDVNQYVVPVEQKVADLALYEYADKWWQWTRTMSDINSPVVDRTGNKCHINQSGDVWFLAGGYGTSKIKRSCTIPQGKFIFFPVINIAYWPRKESKSTCEKIKRSASLNNNNLLHINVELNGQQVKNPKNFRLQSDKCFDLLGLIPEKYNAPKVFPSASDGYWVMLKPLPKGEYSLTFTAQYNRPNGAFGGMTQDIEYKVLVE